MKCQKCQAENPEHNQFCRKCGTKLSRTCPNCSADVLLADKFCGKCGHELGKLTRAPEIDFNQPQSYTPKFLTDKILNNRSSIEGERKLVTILFADVADYTSMAEKLDPEKVHLIMDGCFKILMDEIHRYEGTINQFTGDGVMALFGAPIAHEDHAQRACYAALAIQSAMVGFNEKLKDETDIDFKLRIGLNTGPVVVGSIGDDLRMDYTAQGDTTNLAARMQQSAESGEILMTNFTQALIRGHFIWESLGGLKVKGKKEPTLTYLLKHTRGIRTRMDVAAEKGLSPLNGRSEELNRLHQLWALTKKGHGQVAFIVGEAGIGKSRLIFEFHRSLSAEKITWLEGHSTAYGGNMPFLPLIDLLKRNFRIEESDTEKTVIQKIEKGLSPLGDDTKDRAPYLKFLFSVNPGDPLMPSMDAQGRRRMIFDSIRLMTIQGSKLRPLVVVFEDLHWIDHDTEDYLKYVIDSLATMPVMLILTYRPDYTNPFGERTFYNRISLKALLEKESLELAKGVLGISKLPEPIEPLILGRAEGNPFYIEEIVKSLEEIGAFRREEAIEAAVDLDQIRIPMSIQDILMARIDRLPEEQKNALQIAAVIGREFDAILLERIAELEDRASEIIGELVGLELIYQTKFYPELAYMFKHALTHEVAYNSLFNSQRKILHAKIGESAEVLYSTRLAEYYDMLAYHFERGGVWEKAVEYLLRVAEKAKIRYASSSAVILCQRALQVAAKSKDLVEEQIRGLSLAGDLASLLGELENANQHYDQAVELSTDPVIRQSIQNKRHRPRSIVRNGAKIVFYEHGGGDDTLLLINPLIYGLAVFQPIIERLCQEFRIITVDPRGTGGSDPLPPAYTLKEHAEDVRAVIEATAAAPCIGIGISRGGNLLVNLVAIYPSLIQKLVMVGTIISPGDLYAPAENWADEFRELLGQRNVKRAMRIFSLRIFSEPETQDLAEQFHRSCLQLPVDTILAFFSPDPGADIGPLLGHIQVPTLVTHGEADCLAAIENAYYLVKNIPRTQFYVFHGKGHLPVFTATSEFCEVLRQFVQTGTVPS
jgi:class 3 adenylate cyclase/pimeloyl-ACP methyl ester carboxylesterase